MAKNELRTLRNWVMDLAYIRDGDIIYTDESVILACLLHTKGQGRGTKDEIELRKVMKDQNLEEPKQSNRKRD